MLTYVTLFNWTEQGVKNVKDTVSRVEKSRQMAEKMGGRLVTVLWTQGKYDIVAITEWPDEDSAMAFYLALASTGNVHSETLRAYQAEDLERFFKKMG
ncbi:MAG: hypothetical protein JWP00_3791 [Chloroflexi bacterium]|jgi:uncharacterized protein with GYD domain|nr:hypothetical protein [Chloroflexota bacterium]